MFWCVLGHANAEGRQVVPAAFAEEKSSSEDDEPEEMWFVNPTTSEVFSRREVMPFLASGVVSAKNAAICGKRRRR